MPRTGAARSAVPYNRYVESPRAVQGAGVALSASLT